MEVVEAVETVEEAVLEDMGQVCGRMPKSGVLLEELREAVPVMDDDAVLRLLEVRPDEAASRAAATATFLLLRSPGPGRPLLPLAHYRGGIWTIPDDALSKVGVMTWKSALVSIHSAFPSPGRSNIR